MNNKIFFSFTLSVFSFVIASEKDMTVQIKINNADVERYEVRDVRRIDSKDLSSGIFKMYSKDLLSSNVKNIYYEYPQEIEAKDIERIHNLKLIITSDAIVIEGRNENQYKNQYAIQFTGDSLANLKKELEKANKASKYEFEIREFQIRLTNQDVTKGVYFSLTEEQFQLISPKSYVSTIVTVCGVAGLMGLFYNSDLYSKSVAL